MIKFMEKYGLHIVVVVFVIVFLGVFGIPLCIRIAKDLWAFALM